MKLISTMVTTKYIIKIRVNVDPRKIIKRSFLSTLYHNMYRKHVIRPIILQPLMTPKTQSFGFANYANYLRIAPPIKQQYPLMKTDPLSGYEIMYPIDYSGKNHYLLGNRDYISENFILILGSFTSSPTIWNGKKPVFVSAINLKGKNKHQYLHVYPVPKVIPKNDVTIDLESMLYLPSSEVLDKLIEDYNKNQL